MWCGEGRRIVGVDVSGEKDICLIRLGSSSVSCEKGFRCVSSTSKEGSLAPPFDQTAAQKSNNLSTIPPSISMHPSNHFSQLTLQLGMKALFRSTIINLGCITLNGRTNTLLTTNSSPPNFSGEGKPRLTHDEGG